MDRRVRFLGNGGISNTLDVFQGPLTVSEIETWLRFVDDDDDDDDGVISSKAGFSTSAETEEIIKSTDLKVYIALGELLLLTR